MKNKLRKILKNKRLVMFLILLLIFIVCVFVLRGVFFPGNGSNYGHRLDGIDKISFKDKDKDKITKAINEDDKTTEAKIVIHGKIINIIFNVNEGVSIDDARAIAAKSLEQISDKVKGFYDIQFMITCNKEKGEEVEISNDDGSKTKEIHKKYPIMGYKNSNRNDIVW